jgi:hypothetical protein
VAGRDQGRNYPLFRQIRPLRYTLRCRPSGDATTHVPARGHGRRPPAADPTGREGAPMSSVVKKRRKKMRKHKHRKMLKKTRWQRKHRG